MNIRVSLHRGRLCSSCTLQKRNIVDNWILPKKQIYVTQTFVNY